MDRRGFIGSILAACAAPAIVRADSLMRIVPRATGVLTLDMITREALNQLENNMVFNQRNIYVRKVAGLATGKSWADAYPSIQIAFANANHGDTIWLDSDYTDVSAA